MRIFVNKTLHNSVDSLLSDFYDLLPPGVGAEESGAISSLGADVLLGEIIGIAEGAGGAIITFLLMLLGLGLMMSLASVVPGRMSAAAECGAAAVSAFAIFMSLYPLFSEAIAATREAGALFAALVPLLVSYITLGGGVATAAATSPGLQFTIWLMSALLELLSGIVLSMLALAVISTLGDSGITRAAKGVKNSFSRIMGLICALLAGTLALQTYISASADSATIRMAKHAAADMIPVVGGAVSGALSTLGGGLKYAGGVIGGGAVAALLSITLAPIVLLLLYKLSLDVAASFLDFLPMGGGVSVFSGFSAALDAVISVYTMSLVIYILEVVILIMGGEMLLG